ncbi:MAG TPA: DUF4321 domain-containing protein [Elusimicrobia bacterium]|nr:DUF4321 domain-containing protein [Elusimicrobiota bacterium]
MGTKNLVVLIVVLTVGALLGTVLGKFIGMIIPTESSWRELFTEQVTAGLHPTTLDLQVIDLTFGFLLKFNLPSVIGILIAAYIFRLFAK